ncbi:hypothetical protein FMM68_11020 [Lachnospiraceae bacterium MD329]|nr:hypothetical protein [Lachnospiraceae bacterium MD329]
MKFEFNGQEFDTDKPICVLGYVIIKDWYSYRRSESMNNRHIQEYGAKVKKFYVTELRFCKFSGNNYKKNNVTKMCALSSQRDESVWIDKDSIIGHSPQECLKIYKEIQEAADDERS